MTAKYIIWEDEMGLDRVAIFDIGQKHIDVTRSFNIKPKSAGFVTLNDSLLCYGDSVSLGLKAEEKDANTIKNLFRIK